MDIQVQSEKFTGFSIRPTKLPLTALAIDVKITSYNVEVHLMDGRIVSVPFAWLPFLEAASSHQREQCEILDGGLSLFWRELGERISISHLLSGANPCEHCWYLTSFYK